MAARGLIDRLRLRDVIFLYVSFLCLQKLQSCDFWGVELVSGFPRDCGLSCKRSYSTNPVKGNVNKQKLGVCFYDEIKAILLMLI